MKIALSILGMILLGISAWAADFPEDSLPGNSRTHVWKSLIAATLPDFKSEGKWPRGIPAQSEGDSAIFSKTAGSGSALQMGIYSGMADYQGPLLEKFMSGQLTAEDVGKFQTKDFRNLGQFRIQVDQPIENLQRVVFQIRVSGIAPTGEFTVFQLIETLFPVTLTFASEKSLAPASKTLLARGLVNGFFEEIWSYEWTFPARPKAEGFAVNWTVYPHSVTTALRLIESDSPKS